MLEERLPLEAASSPLVRRQLLAAARRVGASEQESEDFALAGCEAYNNALLHGTGRPGDEVLLQIWAPAGQLVAQITYPGKSFPTSPPTLPGPSSLNGRGRYLMEQLTDRVEYEFRKGVTTVRLEKAVSS